MKLSSPLVALAALFAQPALAAPARLVLEPEATQIRFHLGATLHSVDGSAVLETGEIRFDTEGGPAAGRIAVDARSVSTGNDSRDEGMHARVLESARYPEITFSPSRLEILARSADQAEVRLSGRIEIHGSSHLLEIPARLSADGDRVTVEARFEIPYVSWGMKDPSVFVLRVAKTVEIQIHAEGVLVASASP